MMRARSRVVVILALALEAGHGLAFSPSSGLAPVLASHWMGRSSTRRFRLLATPAGRMPEPDEIDAIVDPDDLAVAALAELSQPDLMCSALSADGLVSAKAIVTSTMVREIATRQGCLPLAAAALGRAMTSSLLIADGLKGDETFQVRGSSFGRPTIAAHPAMVGPPQDHRTTQRYLSLPGKVPRRRPAERCASNCQRAARGQGLRWKPSGHATA